MRKLKSQVAHLQRFPDAHVGWTWFAVRAGLKAIREQRVTAIYSTAAPFTNHLVAYILHKLTKLPWLLELRDGWYEWNFAIFPDYPRWRHWLERPLERAAITSASKAILVTDLMAEKFRRQFPST